MQIKDGKRYTAYGDGEANPIEFAVEVIAQLIKKSGSTAERIAIEEKYDTPIRFTCSYRNIFPKPNGESK
ncbi:MAG: hypothetical protein U5P10_13345 [Spirochaetia bacterium]|nr:hypothetical protein [Spirochaetia bacterium]